MDPPRLLVPASVAPNPDRIRGGPPARRLAAMGVDFPATPLTPAERVLRQLYGATFLTYRDTFGEDVTLETVQDWISGIPAEAILGVCSVMSRYASVHSR